MQPIRQNLAISIDGGGILGIVVARAMMDLETALGEPVYKRAGLTAGTSTGAILTAGIAADMDAPALFALYKTLGESIFPKSWRTLPLIEFIVAYRYPNKPLLDALKAHLGDVTLGDIHASKPDFNMVLTTNDVYAAKTRFLKLYKGRYAAWRLADVVMASSTIPTVFPVFEHDYKTYPDDPPDENWIPADRFWVDGGVGSYNNPAYLAAYEIEHCLRAKGWTQANTTLISIGTGINPLEVSWTKKNGKLRNPAKMLGPGWLSPAIDLFLSDANDQQLKLTQHFFPQLDFRRFNVNYKEIYTPDDVKAIPQLIKYGEELGQKIVNDKWDTIEDMACGGHIDFVP